MSKEDITVDFSLHNKLGITVLTSEQVKGREMSLSTEKWPKDEPFEPVGITFKEACVAMQVCQE
jgi:hypothetical protein